MPHREQERRLVLLTDRIRRRHSARACVLLGGAADEPFDRNGLDSVADQQPHQPIRCLERQGFDQGSGIVSRDGLNYTGHSPRWCDPAHRTPPVHSTGLRPELPAARRHRSTPRSRVTRRWDTTDLGLPAHPERSTPDASWGALPSPESIRSCSVLLLPLPNPNWLPPRASPRSRRRR